MEKAIFHEVMVRRWYPCLVNNRNVTPEHWYQKDLNVHAVDFKQCVDIAWGENREHFFKKAQRSLSDLTVKLWAACVKAQQFLSDKGNYKLNLNQSLNLFFFCFTLAQKVAIQIFFEHKDQIQLQLFLYGVAQAIKQQ